MIRTGGVTGFGCFINSLFTFLKPQKVKTDSGEMALQPQLPGAGSSESPLLRLLPTLPPGESESLVLRDLASHLKG